MRVRGRLSPSVVRRLLGLLAAPLPVVVVLVLTTAAQRAPGTSLVARLVAVAPALAPVLYVGSLLIATLVAAPAVYLLTRVRGHRLADYVAIGAGTGLFTMLGYYAALAGLSLEIDGGELLRLLAIGASLGAVSGGLGFWVTTSGGREEPRGESAARR